jgi:endonuclease YncB( thermonuclease family)
MIAVDLREIYAGLYIHAMRFILLFTLLILYCLVQAGTLTGRVVRVSDGDTIVVLDANNAQYKIRLTGTDAPESGLTRDRVIPVHINRAFCK